MSAAPHALRRRAAVAVLASRLDESALVQELWFQHDTMRGESVADLIAFVDAVADRHLFDAATRKRLYTELYQALRQAPDSLPLDPWPMMQASRAAAAPPPPSPVLRAPAATPPPVAPASLQPVAAALAAATAAPATDPTPPTVTPADTAASDVFAATLRSVVSAVRGQHPQALDEVARDTQAAMSSLPVSPACAAACRQAWRTPREADWRLPGSATDLAMLVRALHQALVENFGRVGAEQILQRALDAAAALPEATTFPPRRLLAAL